MNRSLSVAVALGLLAGFAGGIVGSTLFSTPVSQAQDGAAGGSLREEQAAAPAAATVSREEYQRLQGLLVSLQMEVDALRSEMLAREEWAPAEEEAAPPRLLDGAAGALSGPSPEIAIVDQRVEAVLNAREEAERQERLARAAERRKERVSRQVERIQEELALTDFQAEKMTEILVAADERRSTLWEGLQDSGDREAMFESMRTIREETETALSTLLLPDQMQKYQEMMTNFRGLDGLGGPGRRDGGNGGGGRGF